MRPEQDRHDSGSQGGHRGDLGELQKCYRRRRLGPGQDDQIQHDDAAIAMKLTEPPRISAATVDPRRVTSKNRSRRFTPVTLKLQGGIQPVISRAAQRGWPTARHRHAARGSSHDGRRAASSWHRPDQVAGVDFSRLPRAWARRHRSRPDWRWLRAGISRCRTRTARHRSGRRRWARRSGARSTTADRWPSTTRS